MEEQLNALSMVGMAAGFGAIIGLEREFADKPAGLRTHMFVAAAAATLMLMGNAVLDQFEDREGAGAVTADPIRIIQSIVVGISFLGAGTIIHQRDNQVEGLTTAASILITSCLGIAVAVGQPIFAGALAISVALILLTVGWIERKLLGSESREDPSVGSSHEMKQYPPTPADRETRGGSTP